MGYPEVRGHNDHSTTSFTPRFILSERLIHWSTAVCFVTLLLTGSLLYFPALAPVVGDRGLIVEVHIYAGFLVLLPLVLAMIYSPSYSELRLRLLELGTWSEADRDWLKRRMKVDGPSNGRFNAGQKLNGAFFLSSLIAMCLTGLVMGLYIPLPLSARQGATFLHDIGFYLMTIVFLGHIFMVIRHRGSFSEMTFGKESPKLEHRVAKRQ
ncbi:MAG: formate dehydrogenase [Acidimicrobiaceae bacterium]|nr:formate dehydrogenase [Acidimicrobiaceae bacterium]